MPRHQREQGSAGRADRCDQHHRRRIQHEQPDDVAVFVAGDAHALPVAQGVAHDGEAGEQAEDHRPPAMLAVGGAVDREAEDAGGDRRDAQHLRGRERFADENPGRQRHQQRRRAARGRIDQRQVAVAVAEQQECVVADMRQDRARKEDPAFRIRERYERRESERDQPARSHDQGHVDQGVVAGLHQHVPGGMHHRRQQHQQGPFEGKGSRESDQRRERVTKPSRSSHAHPRRGKLTLSMADRPRHQTAIPLPRRGRVREGEAVARLERTFARFPHPDPPPVWGRE